MAHTKSKGHLRLKAVLSTLMFLISTSAMSQSAHAANTTTQTIVVGFSIVGGDMGGGGAPECLPSDYSLSVTAGTEPTDPSAGEYWLSEDLTITQNDGVSCPGDAVITSTSIEVEATTFINSDEVLLDTSTNILCDGDNSTAYGVGKSTTSCPADTDKVNIEVTVPVNTTGTNFQSTVIITAIIGG